MSGGLLVEGSPQSHGTPTPSVPLATPGPSGSTGAQGTTCRQLVPISKKGNTTNVKVIQATMRRQANDNFEFTSTRQTFIDVTDSTENVHYITNVVNGALNFNWLQLWDTRYIIVQCIIKFVNL